MGSLISFCWSNNIYYKKAHINTRKLNWNLSTITDVFPNQKRVNVCEHTIQTVPPGWVRGRKREGVEGWKYRKQLKWYGHLLQMEESSWPKKICQWSPHGRRKRGRTKWRISWKAEIWKIFLKYKWIYSFKIIGKNVKSDEDRPMDIFLDKNEWV